MSKGISGLFEETEGQQRCNSRSISEIKSEAESKIKTLISDQPGGKTKAMVVGAYDICTGQTIAAFAGAVPSDIHPLLIERANMIGGIGSLGVTSKNTVGVCAEFHAVNNLLNSGSDISNIRLTRPIRPRTGGAMPYCENCKIMFADLIED